MSKGLKIILILGLAGLGWFVFMFFFIAYRPPKQKTAGYLYEVNDATMQAAVWRVIKSDTNMSVPPASKIDYYNDSTQFISMTMKVGTNKTYHYTLMYYGDLTYRSGKDVSELIIHDYRDPSRPHLDNSSFFFAAKADTMLINTFERRFIDKLDKELGMGHNKEIK